MACCLTASRHYLNQCCLTISEIFWHSPEGNYTGKADMTLKMTNFYITITSSRGLWVKTVCYKHKRACNNATAATQAWLGFICTFHLKLTSRNLPAPSKSWYSDYIHSSSVTPHNDDSGVFFFHVSKPGRWSANCYKAPFNKIWWLCLVPTSTTRFASDVGYRMAKIW